MSAAVELSLTPRTEDIHADVCRFITERYRCVYGANIDCGYQNLMYVTDAERHVVAACGIRSAREPLFLERYLSEPLEDTLSRLYGTGVDRDSVVEIGHLTAVGSGAAGLLMDGLWHTLRKAGVDYLMLTCTQKLIHRFRGLPVHMIAEAQQCDAGDEYDWGSYYEQQPRVMSGRVVDYDHRFRHLGVGAGLKLGHIGRLS